jgi:hypothetical protein
VLNPDFRDMLSALSAEGVEYLIVEGYALAAHGFPRATKDIDIWVRPNPENANRTARALRRFGAPAELIDEESLSRPGIILQIGVPPHRIDVMTQIDGIAFEDAWASRLVVPVDGLSLPVIGRGELIRNKRSTGRRQDLLDADRLEGREE